MLQIYFLLALAFIWVLIATINDLKKTEIPNWITLTLIIFALGFRFFYSLFMNDYNFFLQGIFGLVLFSVIGVSLYFSRMFAFGDVKLMGALGVVIPFSDSFRVNLKLSLFFIIIFFIVSFVYTLLVSIVMSVKNSKKFKKEFRKSFRKGYNLFLIIFFVGIALVIFGLVFRGFESRLFFFFGAYFLVSTILYIFVKTVDKSSLVSEVSSRRIQELDILFEDVIIGSKRVKSRFSGLTKDEVNILRRSRKKIKIKKGVVFGPVFLISLAIYILFTYLKFFLSSIFGIF